MHRLKSLPPAVTRTAQIVVAACLLLFLWRAADGEEAVRLLRQADPFWLLAAVAALSVQTVLSSLRWRLTAAQLGIRLGRWEAVREYYLSQIVNQSLPGGMIGDAGRAVRSRAQAGLLASGQAVVFERLAGQIAMFATLVIGFCATFFVPGGLDWPAWLVLPVGLFVLGGVSLPILLWFAADLPGWIGKRLTALWRPLRVALAAPNVWPWQVLLSIGTTICNLSAFTFCVMAVGATFPLIAVIALVPLILFTMLIPISISGWGLREGAAAALFPFAGASASEGFAASVAFGLVFIVSVMPGILPLVQGRQAKVVKS